jgi:hypothetical protein
MTIRESYDLICSIGELVDKLSIENIKCYDANNTITRTRADARAKGVAPDALRIADLELAARTAGEQRCRLKDEINLRLDEALRRGTIRVAKEVRTYGNQ